MVSSSSAAVPLVALLFEHGSFSPDDTQRTATAMLWYAPALLALGWREMVVRASYALGDSRRPVLVFVFAMSINVVGDFTLGLTFGIAGLAASTSLSVLFAAVANTWLLGRRHGAVDLRSLPLMVGRTAAAAAVGTAAGAASTTCSAMFGRRALQRAAVGLRGRPDPGSSLHRRLVRATCPRTPAAHRGHRRSCAASPVVTSISSGRKLPGWTDAKS